VISIKAKTITNAVADLCIKSNYELPKDVMEKIKEGKGQREVRAWQLLFSPDIA